MVVLLDTNIIIDHLRQPPEKSVLARISAKIPYQDLRLSILTIQELYSGTSTLSSQKEKILLAVIAPFTILPYTYEVAQRAGILFRDLDRPIHFADAGVAATAIVNHIPLCTLNQKDFSDIPELVLTPLSDIAQ